MSPFVQKTRKNFEQVSERLLGSLKKGEELTISFGAEESLFIRFNGNSIRQNTDVEQLTMSLRLHANGRTVEKSRSLSGNSDTDVASMQRLLDSCREEATILPADPYQVPIQNNGNSREEFAGALLSPQEIVENVLAPAKGSDLAGLYGGGSVIQANRNSAGQSHWFATETFFMDYSLYDGPRAAKAVYSGARWNQDEWAKNFSRCREQLQMLSKPAQAVKPGKYRTYLAPGALSGLLALCGWGGLSAGAWKQGRSPFKKLADGETKLSPLFTLNENFGLGFSPRFNSLGEMAPASLTLIEKGALKEMLVSSRSAKEYGLRTNGATEGEQPRAIDVLPGTLEEKDILKELGTGLYLSNLHYLNWSDQVTARVTGMTRYACFWVEDGKIQGPIKDLRFDESIYDALGSKLVALTHHTEIDPEIVTYGGRSLGGSRTPGALINDFTFTL
jgi:predicted Zn-dependent protease